MNSSGVNFTGSEPGTIDVAVAIGKAIALSMILITSLTGNILIIAVIGKNKPLQKSIMNFFILNMAASDLIIPLISIPLLMNQEFNYGLWLIPGTAGLVLCKWIWMIDGISAPVSVLSLVFMTFDRFVAILFPLYRIPSKAKHYLVAATWNIAVWFVAPYYYFYSIFPYGSNGEFFCALYWQRVFLDHGKIQRAYLLAKTILLTAIPFIILIVLYASIFIKLRRQGRARQHCITSEQICRRQQQTRRIAKLSFAIVLGFVICFAPDDLIIYMIQSFVYDWAFNPDTTWQALISTAHFLSLSNAAVNPIICFTFNEGLRKGLRGLLLCEKRQMRQGTYSTNATTIEMTTRRRTIRGRSNRNTRQNELL